MDKNYTATEIRKLEEEFYKKDHFPSMTKFAEEHIDRINKLMEEMANAPREEMGKRQSGEVGAYERYNRERGKTFMETVG